MNKKYANFPDQYGLNIILNGKWGKLDSRWNQFPNIYSKRKPYIIHYANPKFTLLSKEYKWDRSLFFYYLDMTEWKGWRPDNFIH